jgi:TolA-binding protein
MKRTLRSLALVALLLAAIPALAGNPELSDKDKLDRILQEVQGVKRELEDVKSLSLQVQNTAKEVRELQRRMESLESSIERLSASRMRVAASYTPNEPAPATATITLQNRSASPATVFINGQPYPAPANSTRRVAGVPAGAFTYEVQAEGYGVIQPLVNRNVGGNEVFTIFINPPAPQLLLEP